MNTFCPKRCESLFLKCLLQSRWCLHVNYFQLQGTFINVKWCKELLSFCGNIRCIVHKCSKVMSKSSNRAAKLCLNLSKKSDINWVTVALAENIYFLFKRSQTFGVPHGEMLLLPSAGQYKLEWISDVFSRSLQRETFDPFLANSWTWWKVHCSVWQFGHRLVSQARWTGRLSLLQFEIKSCFCTCR